MPLSQHVIEDYRTQHLSLKQHPLSFLRETLRRRGIIPGYVVRIIPGYVAGSTPMDVF